ncbi:MAG: hypothetical protein K8T20_06985, partial [Planctomycetes bacterium]|nr:hypothetical protein [Planctomycetota bacterium]
MGLNHDWLSEMTARGLLTAEQAAEARSCDTVASPPPAASPRNLLSAPTPLHGTRLLSCVPCNKAFGVDGAAPAAEARCPECGGGLNPMQYGRLAGTGTPSGVASIFSAETPLNGTPQPFGRYLLRRE